MKKSINPYWLLGSIIFLFIVLLSSIQLIPKFSNDLDTRDLLKSSLNYLKVIADKPHYYGSLEKENIKNYIISVIESFGYKANVQKGQQISISNNFANQMVFAMVENIYVEIPGKNSSKILIVTHYDSVPYSSGA
ncbi:MAG: hypothetical protein ACK4YF_04950, partial [Exilispira sp.]